MLAQSHRFALAACGAVVAVALLGGAPGCAAGGWPEQPESRVFDSQPQREQAAASAQAPTPPWYARRRDHQPTVVVGPRAPVVERSVTVTTDRQRIIRGHVRDHHRTTTYRREERAGVR